MPTRDGTGPMGQGSRTGRGMGNCGTTGENTGKIANTTQHLAELFAEAEACGIPHSVASLDAGVETG